MAIKSGIVNALKITGAWFVYFICALIAAYLLSDNQSIVRSLIFGAYVGLLGTAVYIVRRRRRPEKTGARKTE